MLNFKKREFDPRSIFACLQAENATTTKGSPAPWGGTVRVAHGSGGTGPALGCNTFYSPNLTFKFPDGFYFAVKNNMVKFISKENGKNCGFIVIEITFSDIQKPGAEAIGIYNDYGMVMRESGFTVKRGRGKARCFIHFIPHCLELYTEIFDFQRNVYGQNRATLRIYTFADRDSKNIQNIKQTLGVMQMR